MRYEILDDDGNVINTIIARPDFVELNYPDHYREVTEDMPNSQPNIQAEIEALERQSLMNRGIRELALRIMEDRAVSIAAEQGTTQDQVLAGVPAYVKFKALDDQIATLRALL